MHAAYLVATLLAALANGYAAILNFADAPSVQVVADRLQVDRRWMVPFGTLLALGAVGLLAGIWIPVLGQTAASGLILYFVCALGAHIRAHDAHIGGAAAFLVLASSALLASFGYHQHW